MAFEQRDGQFSLFPNEAHEPGDNKPSMRGRGMWRGELIEFAVWTKQRADGSKYLSGKMQEPKVKEPAESKPVSARRSSAEIGRDDMDSEIPF